MKLATYNVNGINGRLPVLLRWLEQSQPDIVCLQELKAPEEKFPVAAIEKAGYGAIWHGQKSWNGVGILARGRQLEETRRGLPGDPSDTHSRYIETNIDGLLIGCLYLPNGNPAPGPKFDYKLAWFDRLTKYAKGLVAHDEPVMLAGDYNVIPTDLEPTSPSAGSMMPCFSLSRGPPTKSCSSKVGPTPSGSSTRTKRSTHSGITFGTLTREMPAYELTISC